MCKQILYYNTCTIYLIHIESVITFYTKYTYTITQLHFQQGLGKYISNKDIQDMQQS